MESETQEYDLCSQMWISSKLITQERDSESFTKGCTVNLRVEGMTGKKDKVVLSANNSTLRCVLEVKDDKYEVDFRGVLA